MPLPLLIVLICAAVLAVLFALICRFYFCFAIRRGKHQPVGPESTAPEELAEPWENFSAQMREGREWIVAQNPEPVSITSRDGLCLRGLYLPRPGATRTLLLAHGYRSYGIYDFSCVARFYHELGCNLLIIDQRAHGRSEGRYIGFGVLERYDLLLWLDFLNSRADRECDIFLDGISMGAASVLMAAGLPLPENVRGIIADCGFTSPDAIFSHILKTRIHLPYHPLVPAISLLSRLVAGYGFRDASTLDAMKTNRLPILFVHGEDDDFVPTRMSKENYAACVAEKELILVPGARHAQSYLLDRPRCEAALRQFFDRYSVK